MKKNNKVIILVVVLIVIVALAYVLTSKKSNQNSPATSNTEVNNELEDSDIVNSLEEQQAADLSAISVPDDFDWRDAADESDFVIEYMTDEDKIKMNIAPEKKVQVLARDKESGIILAYKVIVTEVDLVTDYQE